LAEARRGRKFDIIVTVRLDRAFRSIEQFVRVVRQLNDWGIRFVCTDQAIDSNRNDPSGQLLMHILAAVAQFERALIGERVKAGIQRVRAQGRRWGGRARKVIDMEAVERLRTQGLSLAQIGLLINCNRNLLGRTVRRKRPGMKKEDAEHHEN